jgi:PAS domain S-box-containing protein
VNWSSAASVQTLQSSIESVSNHPAFGQADLSNCDRELIHLAGSIQPHGLLWVLQEPELHIVQASATSAALLGCTMAQLLGMPLAAWGGDMDPRVRELATGPDLHEGAPLRCTLAPAGTALAFEGLLHRGSDGLLIAEIEPLQGGGVETVDVPGARLQAELGRAVQRLSEASTITTLADTLVRSVRELAGYDRVMVYQFDPEGHGKIIAEARHDKLDSLLGHHYPASDIPQRARELYLRNRVRVLVDVDYAPSPLQPQRLLPQAGGAPRELDMSMCYLRSMSPLHIQYLKNMGVTATLVVSLVREGRLWGLIACHHYQPRNLRFAVRAAADLLGEVASTRIGAIENYARAQVAIQVQRLEQRLVEATSTDGDWRQALFRNPAALLQPVQASGAALFHEGQWQGCGETPSTPELRALLHWIQAQPFDGGSFACASVAGANPALASLTPTASGVLAVRLSSTRPDMLIWFRKEQLLSVTWAGDPSKPMVDNNPLELSPRRSFAAWSELVRGTSLRWTDADIALGRAYGDALVDIIVQVNAVRLLIAEHQLAQVRDAVTDSKEPVVVADSARRAFYANDAFLALAACTRAECASLDAMVGRFADPAQVRQVIGQLQAERRSWRGELSLAWAGGRTLPVAVRAEPVPARDGSLLGMIFIFEDLTDSHRAAAARHHLEASLSEVGRGLDAWPHDATRPGTDDVVAAILTNASLAAMDIADGGPAPAVAPLLQELESSTERATALYARIKSFTRPGRE